MTRRYEQPQGQAEIDWFNPLSRGLIDAFLGPQMARSSVLGRVPISTGSVVLSAGKFGVGASATNKAIKYDAPNFGESGEFTVITIFTSKTRPYRASYVRKDGAIIPVQGADNDVRSVPWSPVTTGIFFETNISTPIDRVYSCVRRSVSTYDVYRNGIRTGGTASLSGYGSTSNPLCLLGTEGDEELVTSNVGMIYGVFIYLRALSALEIEQISSNPWQIFKGVANSVFIPQGFGPVNHVTEGSPEGPGADTTGSAAHRPTNVEHETGGAPKGFQASVTGVAERDRFHVTGGSVEGFTSTVAGMSTRYRMHPVTGAVVADYATVTGDAASSSPAGVHECEGIVVASEAIVVGTALNFSKLTSSGAVKGYQSTVTGAAKNVKKHSTNGAPIGRATTITGTAARLDPVLDHGTFGEVDGYHSSVTGNAINQGAMTLTPADISAIVAALQAAILPVDIVRVNHIDVDGTGADSDPWGPV